MNCMVSITDATLRSAELAPGVSFTSDQKVQLAASLAAAGIAEIEAGGPSLGREEQDDFRRIMDAVPDLPIIAWSSATRSDIETTLACGVDHIHMSMPVSDAILLQKLGKSRSWALKHTADLVAMCRDRGAEVIIGADYASWADASFVQDFFGAGISSGARRVRYVDTAGCLKPQAVRALVELLTKNLAVPLEFQASNDFGLATANAISAVEAGATTITCTLGGLGERGGSTAVEEIVMCLRNLLSIETGVYPAALPELCRLAARYSKRPIHVQKPIVGDLVFAHESGIHVDGLLKDESLYTYLDPSDLGRQNHVIPGKYSGTAALVYCAKLLGYELKNAHIERIHNQVLRLWTRSPPANPWQAFHGIVKSEIKRGA